MSDALEEVRTENEIDIIDEGYFLRSKRRKLENKREVVTQVENFPVLHRKNECAILLLPTEMLGRVFKFIPNQEISNNLRLVNRRFKTIAEDRLRRNFKLLERRINSLLKASFDGIQATQDDMEMKCLLRMTNLLEMVNFQHSVIMSTIWRYVYNHRYPGYESTVYAGSLLDIFEEFIWKVIHVPHLLYGPAVLRDYALPTEVSNIIQLTKTFCLHFEKLNEESVNTNLFVSGCKLIDLLDCATFAKKEVVYEEIIEGKFCARYDYFFNNTWFVAMDIPSEKQMTWQQKQRMMHMRIRRILLAHTEMFMQQHQYEREVLLRPEPYIRIRKPSNNVYTGYGDIHDKFFYYGVMNDGAYMQKFHPEEPLEELMEDILGLNDDEGQAIPENNNDDQEDQYQEPDSRLPFLGLHINVKIDCPLSHAPQAFLEEKCPLDPFTFRSKKDPLKNKKIMLRLEFHCPGAQFIRLPHKYLYHFQHKM